MKRVIGFLVMTVVLSWVAGTLAQDPTPAAQGWRQFVVQGCYGCHTVGKVGTPIGPDLTRVGLKYSQEALARWLVDPEAERPGAHMPLLELTPEQIETLAAFLAELRGS